MNREFYSAKKLFHFIPSPSRFEIYGTVTGVCDELGKAAKEAEAALRKQRRILKNNMVR